MHNQVICVPQSKHKHGIISVFVFMCVKGLENDFTSLVYNSWESVDWFLSLSLFLLFLRESLFKNKKWQTLSSSM